MKISVNTTSTALAGLGIITIISIIIGMLFMGPIITIWCLNTLFQTAAIPYTFHTWFAAFLLIGFLKFVPTNK